MYYQVEDAIGEGFSKCSSSESKSLESFSGHIEEPDEHLYHLNCEHTSEIISSMALCVKYSFAPLFVCANS